MKSNSGHSLGKYFIAETDNNTLTLTIYL